MSHSEVKWILNSPEYFHWANWNHDQNVVLYHEGSGDALMLNPLGECVLKLLEKKSKSSSELIESVCTYFDIAPDAELVRTINSTLSTFRDIGLIRSVKL